MRDKAYKKLCTGIRIERASVSITPYDCSSHGFNGCVDCPNFVAVVSGKDGELCVLCRRGEIGVAKEEGDRIFFYRRKTFSRDAFQACPPSGVCNSQRPLHCPAQGPEERCHY